jgi:3-isopropylmalate/(R)-2-methylmalate dehydratase small subunit
MEKKMRGTGFVLGDNIDTDQIIPAEYLSYNPADPEERKLFGKYALSGVPKDQSGLPEGNLPFVKYGKFTTEYKMIVAGRNFGCGSSREHAPLAISQANCSLVIAESYARIFYRNSVNGGYLLPLQTPKRIVDKITTGDELVVDIPACELRDLTTDQTFDLAPLGDIAQIVEAGGIFDYAKQIGLLK